MQTISTGIYHDKKYFCLRRDVLATCLLFVSFYSNIYPSCSLSLESVYILSSFDSAVIMTGPCFTDDQEKDVHMSVIFFSYSVLMRIQREFQLFFLKRLLCCCSGRIFSNYNKNIQKYSFIQATVIVESQSKTTSFVQPPVQLGTLP